MLLLIGLILLILWAAGSFAIHVGGIINILLIIALIVLIYNFWPHNRNRY